MKKTLCFEPKNGYIFLIFLGKYLKIEIHQFSPTLNAFKHLSLQQIPVWKQAFPNPSFPWKTPAISIRNHSFLVDFDPRAPVTVQLISVLVLLAARQSVVKIFPLQQSKKLWPVAMFESPWLYELVVIPCFSNVSVVPERLCIISCSSCFSFLRKHNFNL